VTARVIQNVFIHEHNRLEAAEQEHRLAKTHYREVAVHRVCGITEHDQRFRSAAERAEAAREQLLRALAV
jgi:hypothetical protein